MGISTLIAVGVVGSLGYAGYKAARKTKELLKWSSKQLADVYQTSLETLYTKYPEANMEKYVELVDNLVNLEAQIENIENSDCLNGYHKDTLLELKDFLNDTKMSMSTTLAKFSENTHFSQVSFDKKIEQHSKTISKISIGVQHLASKCEQA